MVIDVQIMILRTNSRYMCKAAVNKKIAISINGKTVSLSEFPAHIIQNTLVGMLKSLKGVDGIDEVKISFKN